MPARRPAGAKWALSDLRPHSIIRTFSPTEIREILASFDAADERKIRGVQLAFCCLCRNNWEVPIGKPTPFACDDCVVKEERNWGITADRLNLHGDGSWPDGMW